MDVQVREVVLALDALKEVEDPAEVGEERVVARPGEDLDAPPDTVDGIIGHFAVALRVGHRTHVGRRDLQVLVDDLALAERIIVIATFEHRHGIELLLVEVRVVQ